MCLPLVPLLAIAGTVIAAGTAVYGGVQAQQTAKTNAKIAGQAAAFDESAARDRAKRFIAAQHVGYAKAGVDVAGTPLDVGADTAAQQEIDALAIRWGGAGRAASLRASGQQAFNSGLASAGSSILSGATSWGSELLKPPAPVSGNPQITGLGKRPYG